MVSSCSELTYIDRREVPRQVALGIHKTHTPCGSDSLDQGSLCFHFLGRPKLARRFLFTFNPNDRLRRIQTRAEKYLCEMDRADQKEDLDRSSKKWKHGKCFTCDITYEPRFIGRMCVKCCQSIVFVCPPMDLVQTPNCLVDKRKRSIAKNSNSC